MKSQVLIGVLVGVVGAASLVACSSTGGGGGGTGGSTATGGGGGVGGGVGGSSSGGMPSGGSSSGGSSSGGMPSGGSSSGGSSSGGGGSVTLPPGCVDGLSANCNPVTNEACNTASGEACDFGDKRLRVLPGAERPETRRDLLQREFLRRHAALRHRGRFRHWNLQEVLLLELGLQWRHVHRVRREARDARPLQLSSIAWPGRHRVPAFAAVVMPVADMADLN